MFGLLRWPGRIVPGVSNRLLSHLDLFPTFATLAGAAQPTRPLDGEDMGPWLFVRANSTPAPLRYARRVHDRVLHIYNCQFSEFLATRVGKYKVWHKNDHKLPVRAASRKKRNSFGAYRYIHRLRESTCRSSSVPKATNTPMNSPRENAEPISG